MHILVTMKVLLAVKVRRVPAQVLAQRMQINGVKRPKSRFLSLHTKTTKKKLITPRVIREKNLYGRRFLTLLLNIAKRLAVEVCMTFVLPRKIVIRV